MRLLIPALLTAFVAISAHAEKFKLDPAHTNVQFQVPHLVVSKVKGHFTKFDGSFDFDEKSMKLDNVMVTIQADSLNTNEADRDKHLRSPDFFDVTKYPTLTFKGTKVNYDNNKPHEIEGDLTIHGVTKKVKLEIDYKGAVTDPWNNRRVAFELEGKVNRKDFGLKWNKAMEAGGFVVGDDVKIEIEGEAIAAAAAPKK
ncbi:MAG: polyisoprenoid-binding protein [Bdellovibrio sp.]|nr:polyisoprenoid-binding protein [Bdellovibrio sp.]